MKKLRKRSCAAVLAAMLAASELFTAGSTVVQAQESAETVMTDKADKEVTQEQPKQQEEQSSEMNTTEQSLTEVESEVMTAEVMTIEVMTTEVMTAEDIAAAEETSATEETVIVEETAEAEETTEEVRTTQEADQQENEAEELIDQTLQAINGGVLITVEGNLPQDAALQVRTEQISTQEKEEITRLSDIIDTVQDWEEEALVWCYDISILSEGKEYEPYEFDETLQISFSFLKERSMQQARQTEVFHMDDEKGAVRVAEGETKESRFAFLTDHFSRYIVIADVNYAGVTQWAYEYSGYNESFQAPVTGIYQFILYGAQGEGYAEYEGGRGGMVSINVELQKGEELECIVGGQNGFNGGGTGTLSHGGGATLIRKAGEQLAVAGGGGGATDLMNGRDGGGTMGTNGLANKGSDSQSPYSAGGGGGYEGGSSGATTYHSHTGDKNGSGCYTSAVRHVHSSSCEKVCGSYGGFSVSGANSDYIDAHCSGCGAWACRPGTMSSPFIQDGSWKHVKQVCGKSTATIEYYNLGCGKSTDTVDNRTAAYGGSSYYDASVCSNPVVQAGVRNGNGKVQVSLIEIDGATISYYNYNMNLLGSITVEKGAAADFPLTQTPQRPEDERYSYTFAGWDDAATQQEERLTDSATVESCVTEDRSYRAVYTQTPQSYVITLDNQGAEVTGSTSLTAAYGLAMPQIEMPRREGYLFAGYYTQKDGAGMAYYLQNAQAVGNSDFTKDTTLYAYWVQPLQITVQPSDYIVMAGYRALLMEVGYELAIPQGYTTTCQWYVTSLDDDGKAIEAPQKIEGAVTRQIQIPQGYHAGKYEVFCTVTVSSSFNGQQVSLDSKAAQLVVRKNVLTQADIQAETTQVVYDGALHEVKAVVTTGGEAEIYYGLEELTKENYKTNGTKNTYAYENAGEYKVYIYLTGRDYEDYAGMLQMQIRKAYWKVNDTNRPVVNADRTVTLPGGEVWEYRKSTSLKEYTAYEEGTRIAAGIYDWRIAADENHYASRIEKVVIEADKTNNGGTGSNGGGSNTGNSSTSNNGTNTGSGSTGNGSTTGNGSGNTGNDNSGNGNNNGNGNGSDGANAGGGSTGGNGDGSTVGSVSIENSADGSNTNAGIAGTGDSNKETNRNAGTTAASASDNDNAVDDNAVDDSAADSKAERDEHDADAAYGMGQDNDASSGTELTHLEDEEIAKAAGLSGAEEDAASNSHRTAGLVIMGILWLLLLLLICLVFRTVRQNHEAYGEEA